MELVPPLRSMAAFTEARSPATAMEVPMNATAVATFCFGFVLLINVATPYVVTCQLELPADRVDVILSTGKVPRASTRPPGLDGSAAVAARISDTSWSGLKPVAVMKPCGSWPIFVSTNCPSGLATALVALTPARIFASGITKFISCESAANAVPDKHRLKRTAICRIKYLLFHANAAGGPQVQNFWLISPR